MENKDRLAVWIDLYTKRLVRIAYTYVRDWTAAEDMVQNAFIKAYRSMDTLLKPDPFPWLVQIVINECKQAKRKHWREVITNLFQERQDDSAEKSYFNRSDLSELHEAVLALPSRYSAPIVLYYFEELPIADIASALNTNVGTIKTRLKRGREQLRLRMKEDRYGGQSQAFQNV
ncbi:RNA polymerase sigma factor [Cohnella terricola]|uniref:RNA polymerase sigma factor n=1 Tax=Cohnella terricola TaxID=1289167 RepID=UPI001645A2A8|nr:sigma-70 family RNA polymerase sigma factor [Cohnella terricola]